MSDVFKNIPRSSGSAFTGNQSGVVFVYSVRQACPEALLPNAVNPRVSLEWTAGNRRSGTYSIKPGASHGLYSEHDGGPKWFDHQVRWDGSNVVFTLSSGGWGCAQYGHNHNVHSVTVTYQMNQLHGSQYATPFSPPVRTF